MNEVVHFTKTQEIKHFAEVKVSQNDNAYGVTWAEVVKNYLTTAYTGGDVQAEVQAFGKTYKVLKRTEVTAFYDKEGNTLFDVTNERLADEYEWLTRNPVKEVEETENEVVAVPMGTTSLAAIVTGNVPTPTEEEVAEAIKLMKEHEENLSDEDKGKVATEGRESFEEEIPAEGNEEVNTVADDTVTENSQTSSVYIGIVGAVTKLQEELKTAKDKNFAEPVIEHLIERCKESESLASDVCQDHKSWEKCYKYIYEQARKQAKGNSCAVRDDVVYEWAEDYYYKDDKAEEEKKAKEAAEKKKKAAEAKPKSIEKKPVKSEPAKPVEEKVQEVQKPKPQPKKNNKDMDGQMDLFSLMGM